MQLQIASELFIQTLKKLQEFLVAMPGVAFPNHLALGQFQCRKERGGPVSLVVVSHRSTPPALQRQSRLSAVQGLNLALFIDTQHQSFGRRIQIQPHHIGQLFQKARVP